KPTPRAAVLRGDLYEYWLDVATAVWLNIGVDLEFSRQGKTIFRGKVDGGEANLLWLGLTSEYEKVVRMAHDDFLTRVGNAIP
ncbi:MAG: hypothetical protein AAF514_03860, partial [Verrucomicrobiota bacterium]